MEKDKAKGEEDTRKNRVRIILTCKEVKKIEKGLSNFSNNFDDNIAINYQ